MSEAMRITTVARRVEHAVKARRARIADLDSRRCSSCRWCVPAGDVADSVRCEHDDSPLAATIHRLSEDDAARWGCILHEPRTEDRVRARTRCPECQGAGTGSVIDRAGVRDPASGPCPRCTPTNS